ncbi:hypothetical protein QL285_045436 [Trifolium repens]|nr:hypothetical protein QL285_045436 [Trifolium repens]
MEHNSKQHEKASKVITQEYDPKANASCAAELKKITPKKIRTKHTVVMKYIEQYTDAATDLKLNDSEPTTVQHLETEVRPVQVHVASDPPMMSSTGSEVHSAPNSVAA